MPTGAEALRIRDEYKACVVDVGLEPPDDVDFVDLERFVSQSTGTAQWASNTALHSCIRQYGIAIFINDV